MQHVSNVIIQFLLLGQTPALETEAMREYSVMVLGITQMRGNGEGPVHARALLDIFGISLDARLGHDGRGLDRRGLGRRRMVAEEGWLTGEVVRRTTVQERAQIGNEERVLDIGESCKGSDLGVCGKVSLTMAQKRELVQDEPTTSRMSTKSESYSFAQVPRRGLRRGVASGSSSPCCCCWRLKGWRAATLALFQRPGRTASPASPAAASCSMSTSGGSVVDGRPVSSSKRGMCVEAGRAAPLGTLRLLLLLLLGATHGGR